MPLAQHSLQDLLYRLALPAPTVARKAFFSTALHSYSVLHVTALNIKSYHTTFISLLLPFKNSILLHCSPPLLQLTRFGIIIFSFIALFAKAILINVFVQD